MIEISKAAAQAAIKAAVKDGYRVSENGVRAPFVAGGLPLGEYQPVAEIQPAITMEPRNEGGNAWDALRYTLNGRAYQIPLSGIMGKTRVVLSSDGIKQGDKWQGEEMQPTEEVWRFGRAMRDMQSKDEGKVGVYAAPAFELTNRVWMVVPEFEEVQNGRGGVSRRPVYTAGCDLREISIVAHEEAADA